MQTQADLDAEINLKLASNTGGLVTAAVLRSVLDDVVAAIFQGDGFSIGTVNYTDGGSHSTNVDGEIRIIDNADLSVTTLFGVHHSDPTKRVFACDAGSDTFNRFYIDGNGSLVWGPGNAAQDMSLIRIAAGVLGFNGVGLPTGASTLVVGAADATAPAGGFNGNGLMFGAYANFFGVFYGSGAPSLAAGKGSLYLRTDGSSSSTRMYVNSGAGISTTWVPVTTAS